MPTPGSPSAAQTREVPVRLGEHSYTVIAGAGALQTLGRRSREALAATPAPGARCFLVADEALPALTIDMTRDALRSAGWRVELASMQAREDLKSLDTAARLLTHMAAARLERAEPVVTLGGGIVGDVAAFAAAVYRRGVPVIQCPTTLLAMVDAAVGGKCGVNLAVPDSSGHQSLKKNMVGAFHQPSLVLCDVTTLDSLPDDELACGFAECLKHALIGADWGDPGLLDWTRDNARLLVSRDRAALIELVARNVAVKARVVEGDEREERADGRGRMALNIGHTVAHAIETLPLHAIVRGAPRAAVGLRHGEAVALGLIAESCFAETLGIAPRGFSQIITDILILFSLPTRLSALPPMETILSAMQDDKKVGAGKLRLALPDGRGKCEVVTAPDPAALRAGIERLGAPSYPSREHHLVIECTRCLQSPPLASSSPLRIRLSFGGCFQRVSSEPVA